MSGNPKIYVVDDDVATRHSLDSMLRSLGYEVESFHSGLALLDRARDGLPGCIVLDVRLPGPSGLEIQRRLAESGIDTPIIFISGHGDIAMAVAAMKANALEFLVKPFREQDLLDAVSEAMDRAGSAYRHAQTRMLLKQQIKALSQRELEVFRLLCCGKIGKQISFDLGISEGTVKVHRRNILQKLKVPNVSQLIIQFGDFATLSDKTLPDR